MTAKPSYEELENRVQELEKIESEHKYSKGALRESESLFKMLYEKAPLGYQSLDENGHFIVVNQTWLDILGYTREEVIGKSFADFLHPDWRDHFKEYFPRFKSIGEVLGVEFEMVKKNGNLILVSFTGKISTDKTGDFQQTHCIFHDITERKRSEEALRRNEKDLKESQRIAHVGSWRLDMATNQVVWTEELYSMYGFDPSLPPPPYTEHMKLFTPESWDRLSTALAHTRETGIPYTLELETIRKDGSNGWMWVRGEAEVDSAGKTVELWGAAQDITERKRAEEVLRESEKKLRATLDATPFPVAVVDLQDDKIFFWSRSALELFGHNARTVTEWYQMAYPDPDNRQDVIEEWKPFLEKARNSVQTVNAGERRITCKDGSGCICEIYATFLPDNLIITFNDITERKKADVEREKLQAQLTQAQKMESVGRLAGGVAHDFNNMLGVILGHTELALLKADENQDLYSDLKEIQNAAKRSADITKQLLAFARKQTISPRQLDLNDTVESILNMLRRLIGEDIDLVWKPSAHLWSVKMDPSQIDQILSNLCVNARDAIDGVGKITIETGRKTFDEAYCSDHPGFIPGDFVLLAVSDNGCGMDKDTLDNLFEPFFTTKEVGKGTGLGLATVYGIVKQNNGFINVYSEPGQGSTFKIYLSRLVADEDMDKVVPDKKAAPGGTETILLVEDEPSILRMTRMMLERKGYTVLSAVTPGEAIDLAKTHADKIHLLMTDVVMPEMNGRDLAEKITALYPGIRRLFMSGYTANVIAHQGVLDEGVAFIQKPFSMGDLAEKLREVLDMASGKS